MRQAAMAIVDAGMLDRVAAIPRIHSRWWTKQRGEDGSDDSTDFLVIVGVKAKPPECYVQFIDRAWEGGALLVQVLAEGHAWTAKALLVAKETAASEKWDLFRVHVDCPPESCGVTDTPVTVITLTRAATIPNLDQETIDDSWIRQFASLAARRSATQRVPEGALSPEAAAPES